MQNGDINEIETAIGESDSDSGSGSAGNDELTDAESEQFETHIKELAHYAAMFYHAIKEFNLPEQSCLTLTEVWFKDFLVYMRADDV